MTYLVAALFVAMFVVNIVAGTLFNVFVAGFMLGVGYMVAIQWYLDRKLKKEIMKEIETLSRNYDNQMSIFDGVRHEDLFPQNNTTTEVTRND